MDLLHLRSEKRIIYTRPGLKPGQNDAKTRTHRCKMYHNHTLSLLASTRMPCVRPSFFPCEPHDARFSHPSWGQSQVCGHAPSKRRAVLYPLRSFRTSALLYASREAPSCDYLWHLWRARCGGIVRDVSVEVRNAHVEYTPDSRASEWPGGVLETHCVVGSGCCCNVLCCVYL